MDDDTAVHEMNMNDTEFIEPSRRPFEIPQECMGPAMLALKSEKQQRFAYFMGCGDMNMTEAMRAAGYSGNANTSSVSAHGHTMMHHNPRVAAAIEEVARKVLYGFVPVCIRNIGNMIKDPKNRKHYEASVMVLDRCGFGPKSEHHLTVEHVDDSRLVSFAMKLADELGVQAQTLVGRLENLPEPEPDPKTTVTDAEGMVYPVVTKGRYAGKWVLTPPQGNDDGQA